MVMSLERNGVHSWKAFFSGSPSSLWIYVFWTDDGTTCKHIICKRKKPVFKDTYAFKLWVMPSEKPEFHPGQTRSSSKTTNPRMHRSVQSSARGPLLSA